MTLYSGPECDLAANLFSVDAGDALSLFP